MNADDVCSWIKYQLDSDGSLIQELPDGVERLDEQGRVGLLLRDVDGQEWEVLIVKRP